MLLPPAHSNAGATKAVRPCSCGLRELLLMTPGQAVVAAAGSGDNSSNCDRQAMLLLPRGAVL